MGPREVQVKEMLLDQRAWVGAMIEAEGSVTLPYGEQRQPRIRVVNTDPEIISALLRATGAGTVCFTNQHQYNPLSTKPCYAWQVQAQADTKSIARQCSEYSMKLQKVEV